MRRPAAENKTELKNAFMRLNFASKNVQVIRQIFNLGLEESIKRKFFVKIFQRRSIWIPAFRIQPGTREY